MARLTLSVNGADLAVWEEGSGSPAFLFIHGLGGDHTAWQFQFDDLARDHRCVSFDLRGCGVSAAEPPFDTTQAADDAADIIRQLDLAPVIVVGHSSGGLVALLLNDRHPGLVRGIVLGDATLSSASGGGWPDTARLIGETTDQQAPLSPLIESFFAPETPEVVRDSVTAIAETVPREVAVGMLSNSEVLQRRMGELLRKADEKPFMAIWSQNPRGNPERLRETLFFIRQEPIPGTGHFFQMEQPAVTNALLRAFLDDVARDPRVSQS